MQLGLPFPKSKSFKIKILITALWGMLVIKKKKNCNILSIASFRYYLILYYFSI